MEKVELKTQICYSKKDCDYVKEQVDNALRAEIQKMNMDGKNEFFTISFAYGYVMSEEFEDCTLRMLIDIADRRMYENKAIMKKISPVAV